MTVYLQMCATTRFRRYIVNSCSFRDIWSSNIIFLEKSQKSHYHLERETRGFCYSLLFTVNGFFLLSTKNYKVVIEENKRMIRRQWIRRKTINFVSKKKNKHKQLLIL